MVPLAIPVQDGLAQPGTRGNDSAVPPATGPASGVQNAQLVGRELEDAVPRRLQVVEQLQPRRADGTCQDLFVQLPGQVRGAALSVEGRTGHPEAGRSRRQPGVVFQIGGEDGLKGLIVPAMICGGAEPKKAASRLLVVGDHGLRAADVAGKDHGASPAGLGGGGDESPVCRNSDARVPLGKRGIPPRRSRLTALIDSTGSGAETE
jgi:hypothetical protein